MLMLTESGLTRQQYTLFSLDMFPSGEGEWEENARYAQCVNEQKPCARYTFQI